MDAIPFGHERFTLTGVGGGHLIEDRRGFVHALLQGKIRPDLLRSEGDHRREQQGQIPQDAVDGGLCSPTLHRIGGLGIKAVFEHIQIEVGHIHRAEVVYRMINNVELKPIISRPHLLSQGV